MRSIQYNLFILLINGENHEYTDICWENRIHTIDTRR